jgi:excisionase family DNA binding protein
MFSQPFAPSRFYGFKEFAALFGVSLFTVRRLVEKGEIKSINCGTRRLISSEEVTRIATEGTGKPRARRRAAGGEQQAAV